MAQISPTLPPGPAELARPGAAQAWKSAQDFEAMALSQFLAPMFESVDSSKSMFGGGEGEATFRPMLTQEYGKQLAKAGGLGLALPIYHQILHLQEVANGGNP